MLPNVLDEPATKLQNLVKLAKVEYDPRYSVMMHIRTAQNMIKLADKAYSEGDLETAFINFMKATSIVLEKVQQGKDFKSAETNPEYIAMRKLTIDNITKVESIKEALLSKFRTIQEIEAEALETAAKAGKPKPPPRPSKPAFLSAAKPDRQPPVPTAPAVITLPTSPPISEPTSERSSPGLSGKFPPMSLPAASSAIIGSYPTSSSAPSSTTAMTPGSMATPSPSPSLPSMIPLQPAAYGSPSSTQNGLASYAAPVAAARPLHTLVPPGSAPANISLGGGYASQQLSPTPPPAAARRSPAPDPMTKASSDDQRRDSTSSNPSSAPSTPRRPPPPDSEYKLPLSISPRRLMNYMRQTNPPRILILDIRAPMQYDNARIKTPFIINIDPLALRDGVSSQQLAEQGLFNRPESERRLFQERSQFQLVVYYDHESTEMARSGPLYNLVQALWDLEYERPAIKPVMLEGGFKAWMTEMDSMDWVEGTGVDSAKNYKPPGFEALTLPKDQPSPQNYTIYGKMTQGGGINRHDGRIISRNIGEYIRAGDSPQSMINPRNPEPNTYRPAYPPYATPYSNSLRKPYGDAPAVLLNGPPAVTGQGGDKQEIPSGASDALVRSDGQNSGPTPPGPLATNHTNNQAGTQGQDQSLSEAEVKLQRRQTIYDNHWNNFGTIERITSPVGAVGGMVTHHGPHVQNLFPGAVTAPGGSSGGVAAGGAMVPSGPSLPRPPLPPPPVPGKRPDTPTRPMRPLPQPPGMSDLKSYTQFGSGFSKIGSQIGKAGLTNLGNTCFMNSVIQCLIATPPLTRFFLDGSYKRNINMTNHMGTKGKLAEAFAELIRNMWSGQSHVISPTSFRQAIIEFAPQFKGTEQHDSQEFLSFLLDGLHEDLKRERSETMVMAEKKRLALGEPEEGSAADDARMEALPEWEASEIAWRRYLVRGNSIVVSIFQGQYRNRLTCSKCGTTSTTYNPFMYLTLPIKASKAGGGLHRSGGGQTLISCLEAFIEPEVLEGENAWHCPRCKKPRKAIKQLTISRLPDVLLIQLKRFANDGPFKNKIKAKVDYPVVQLDLTRYLPARPPPPPPPIRPSDPAGGGGGGPPPLPPPPPQMPAVYDLYAVSNHSGEVSNGHYTACVRGATPESWTNFDDTRVSPCDKSVAVSEHGYTLFYVRRH